MSYEQQSTQSAGLLKRLPTPVFWLLALFAGVAGAAVLFVAGALAADAITHSSESAGLWGLASALIGFVAPLLYLRKRRTEGQRHAKTHGPAATHRVDDGSTASTAEPHQQAAPPRRRPARFDKLIDLSFKEANGVRRFYPPFFSQGYATTEVQEIQLRHFLRRYYFWSAASLIAGTALLGPVLAALVIPALILSYAFNVIDIVTPSRSPDRVTAADQLRAQAAFFPRWTGWVTVIASGVFVATGYWMLVSAIVLLRHANATGDVSDGLSILKPCFVILFFSCCMVVGKTMLDIDSREQTRDPSMAPPAGAVTDAAVSVPRRAQSKWGWLAVAVVAAIVILAGAIMFSDDNQNLKVTSTVLGLQVVNLGSDPIRILDVKINGRDECSRLSSQDPHETNEHLHKLWLNGDQTQPQQLKSGDAAFWVITCHSQIINATIKTDNGTATYTFE